MPDVSPISLGVLLLARQRARLSRFGEVNISADLLKLLDHEPPTGRCLEGDLELSAVKA
jgi:hypothetical protein